MYNLIRSLEAILKDKKASSEAKYQAIKAIRRIRAPNDNR